MSDSPRRSQLQHVVASPNTPEELEAATARYREQKTSALYQIGCSTVVDVPLPLLAQYITELPAADQQEFLKELVEHLPVNALHNLDEAMQARLGRGAA